MQRRIADSAYRTQQRIEGGSARRRGREPVPDGRVDTVEIVKIGPKHQDAQVAGLRRLRASATACWSSGAWTGSKRPRAARENLMFPLKEALAAYATIGECCDRLRGVFGEYQPPDIS